MAAPGPFGVVGCRPVLVDERQKSFGGLSQRIGIQANRGADQGGLGLLAGGQVHPAGQPLEERADDADVFGADGAGGLGAGGGTQFRIEGLAGHGGAWAQLAGLGQSTAGLDTRDPQSPGQHGAPGRGPQRHR